jgi:hypothetical protein
MHGDDFHESYAHWLHVMTQQADSNESLAGMMAAAVEVVKRRGTVWFDQLVSQYERGDES